ncbi:MAG TPA: hypothetical protein VNW52_08920 [Burkholderiaceae bacterium]|jgi:hypothetical protein|nr:hypothetical protein [Burkholderiaceae bacterium]
MSVSSIISGSSSSQMLQNNVVSQRTVRQEPQVVAVDNTNVQAQEPVSELTAAHPITSAPLFNLVGVAAYSAIMNPQSSTSMSIEA